MSFILAHKAGILPLQGFIAKYLKGAQHAFFYGSDCVA